MTINTQQVASIVRQLAAVAAIVIGSLSSINLPTSVHGILVAAGAVLLAIEHYVGDPSTGTTTTSTSSFMSPAPPAVKPVVPPSP